MIFFDPLTPILIPRTTLCPSAETCCQSSHTSLVCSYTIRQITLLDHKQSLLAAPTAQAPL